MYFAFKCVRIANEKNRSNNWWVLLAGFFGVFAYILIEYLPPLPPKKEKGIT